MVLRILVVDDLPPLRVAIGHVVQAAGHRVVGEASDGLAALSLAEDQQPDLILLDVEMPGLSGLEALPDLRRLAPAATILMLTSRSDSATVKAAVAGGAHGYVIKDEQLAKALPGRLALVAQQRDQA